MIIDVRRSLRSKAIARGAVLNASFAPVYYRRSRLQRKRSFSICPNIPRNFCVAIFSIMIPRGRRYLAVLFFSLVVADQRRLATTDVDRRKLRDTLVQGELTSADVLDLDRDPQQDRDDTGEQKPQTGAQQHSPTTYLSALGPREQVDSNTQDHISAQQEGTTTAAFIDAAGKPTFPQQINQDHASSNLVSGRGRGGSVGEDLLDVAPKTDATANEQSKLEEVRCNKVKRFPWSGSMSHGGGRWEEEVGRRRRGGGGEEVGRRRGGGGGEEERGGTGEGYSMIHGVGAFPCGEFHFVTA